MSNLTLPKIIDPLRLAKNKAHFAGQLLVKDLGRLENTVANTEGEIKLELDFGIDLEGYTYIKGRIQTTLYIICQRCLQSMPYPLDILVLLSPVMSDDAAKLLPEAYEPLLLNSEGTVSLNTLVEEELLLSLPFSPRHEQCPAQPA